MGTISRKGGLALHHATLAAAVLGAMLVAGCGGGSGDSYEELKDEADSLRSQAISLVSRGPCSEDNQCTGLEFRYPYPTCEQHDEYTYSKLSPGALAAEALADRQRSVARDALAKAPGSSIVCPAVVQPEPRHVCVSNRCEQRPG